MVKRKVWAHFMKVGDVLTDGCTNSIGHTPVSSCMPCAASGTRNGCCAQTWILWWFRAGWNAAVTPTSSVLCCQCNCHFLPWAVASMEKKHCARGKKPLGRKCRTPPAGIVLGLSGRVMSLSAVSISFQATDRCSTASLTEQSVVPRETARIVWHCTLLKRELQEQFLPRKLISPCIREVLGLIWSRIWHSAYHWYSITDTLIHLQLEARVAGIHICRVTLCSSALDTQSWSIYISQTPLKKQCQVWRGCAALCPAACCLQLPAGRFWGAWCAQGPVLLEGGLFQTANILGLGLASLTQVSGFATKLALKFYALYKAVLPSVCAPFLLSGQRGRSLHLGALLEAFRRPDLFAPQSMGLYHMILLSRAPYNWGAGRLGDLVVGLLV